MSTGRQNTGDRHRLRLRRDLRKTMANGVSISHTYDPASREVLLQNIAASGVGPAIYAYAYDAISQLKSETRSGSAGYGITYTYDSVGNRLTLADGSGTSTSIYGPGNELLTLTSGAGLITTSTYDANGNLLQENAAGQVTSYGWNYENRLTRILYPDASRSAYQYSIDGFRQRADEAAGAIRFVWDRTNVLQETDQSGNTLAHLW